MVVGQDEFHHRDTEITERQNSLFPRSTTAGFAGSGTQNRDLELAKRNAIANTNSVSSVVLDFVEFSFMVNSIIIVSRVERVKIH